VNEEGVADLGGGGAKYVAVINCTARGQEDFLSCRLFSFELPGNEALTVRSGAARSQLVS